MSGERKPAIDLTRNKFVRNVGDLMVFGTWIWNEDQEDTEPCLAIMPLYRKAKPCIVTLSYAHLYTNPRFLESVSRDYAQSFDMRTEIDAFRVADLIMSSLRDLLTMPPDPTEAIAVGEVVITDGGKKRTAEILDYQPIQ